MTRQFTAAVVLASLTLTACGANTSRSATALAPPSTTAATIASQGPMSAPTATATSMPRTPTSTIRDTNTAGALRNNEIIVIPTSGPVGTAVTIRGRGCAEPGYRFVNLGLESQPSKTDIGRIPENSAGYFTDSWVVPSRTANLSGAGQSPTRPGTYDIASHPPFCQATFRVTAR